MYYFLQRYQRSGKNVKCKLRKRYTRGEAAFTIFRPLTLGNSNSDRQPRPNSGAHSIIFDTCALFCLVSISAVAKDYSPPSLGGFKLNEAPPGELGCFKLPKSQKSFLLGRRQTSPSSAASLTLLRGRVILFLCRRYGKTHLAGAPQGFFFADVGLKI